MIAICTGARVAEIAQLSPMDVEQVEGIWILKINEEGGKRVETAAGIRTIPLHDELLRLGLASLAARRAAAGEKRLLPNVPVRCAGHGMSRWLSEKFLDRAGLKRKGLGFHGLRHSFKTMLRRAHINADLQNRILGHEDKTVGAGYREIELEALQKALQQIELPEQIGRFPPRVDPSAGGGSHRGP